MVSNSEKSVELRKKKKKILEEVMDTETYKVAKEILDRFGDKPQQTPFDGKAVTTPSSVRPTAPGMELRHRQVESQAQSSRPNAPIQPNTPSNVGNAMKLQSQQQKPQGSQPQQQMLSTQRYEKALLLYALIKRKPSMLLQTRCNELWSCSFTAFTSADFTS